MQLFSAHRVSVPARLHLAWARCECLALSLLLVLLATFASAAAAPAPLRDLKLIDQRGNQVRASLHGRPLLLHFVFTACSSACPVQVRELVAVHRALPDDVRAQVRFVSVTLDPLSDTPKKLAAFAHAHGAERNGWLFATGPAPEVGKLAERMHVFDERAAAKNLEQHRTSLYLFRADGTLMQKYRGAPLDRARLVREISEVARMPTVPEPTER